MNSTLSFIEDFWYTNEQSGISPVLLIQKISDDPKSSIYIGYNELGNRCLLLNVDPIGRINIQIKNTNINLKTNESSKLLYIELVDKYFGELFNDLIISIYDKLYNLPDDLLASKFIMIYKKWNELFKNNENQSPLSESQLLGLIGELSYLRVLLSSACSPVEVNNIIASWGGPDGKATDFTFSDVAFEIKTIANNKDFIDISSEFQLSCANRSVYLVVYRAEISDLGLSLYDLVISIRNELNLKLGETEEFLHKINSFKLDFINISNYKTLKFKLGSPITYDASLKEFPKITDQELMPGIFGVKYKINLNKIAKFKI